MQFNCSKKIKFSKNSYYFATLQHYNIMWLKIEHHSLKIVSKCFYLPLSGKYDISCKRTINFLFKNFGPELYNDFLIVDNAWGDKKDDSKKIDNNNYNINNKNTISVSGRAGGKGRVAICIFWKCLTRKGWFDKFFSLFE